MNKLTLAVAVSLLGTVSALAFDGWKLESTTALESKMSAWDYLTIEPNGARLFIGHRKEGLQVYDIAAKKLVRTVEGTVTQSSNGATLMPEFDLGISNNEDGTITPFKLSTLEASAPIKLGEELDTSHYDPVTKRVLVNMAAGKESTELLVLQAPKLDKIGAITVKTKKPEHAEADGMGNLYMASRDLEAVYKFDMKEMKVAAEYPTPGCGQTNSIALDVANRRIFLACRGNAKTAPSLAVMDMDNGKIIYTAEIGGGNDGIVYDPELKRIFTSNGVHAVMNIFEQVDANTYKPLEAVGTQAGVRALAYNGKTKKLYSITADGSADYAKKITTSVSPWYANTFVPNTFRVLVYSR